MTTHSCHVFDNVVGLERSSHADYTQYTVNSNSSLREMKVEIHARTSSAFLGYACNRHETYQFSTADRKYEMDELMRAPNFCTL